MTSIFEKIRAFVRTRTLLFWVFLAGCLLVVTVIVQFLSTHSFVAIEVKYNDGIDKPATLYATAKGADDAKLSPLISNLYFIKRGTVALRASSGTYSTIKELSNTAPQETVTINLYKDKNATKYSGNNPGCITYDGAADRLLSYSCTQPRELVEYRQASAAAAPQNHAVAMIAPQDTAAYSVKPYQGGVLGIRMPRFVANVPTNDFLFAIDGAGKTTEAAVPDALDQNQLGATNVVTDTTSRSQSSFLLVAKQSGKVYFADRLDPESMSYKEYALPNDFSPVFDTLLCSLVQSTAYCSYGYGSGPPDSNEETERHKTKKPATFLTIDFSGDTPVANQYATKEAMPVDLLFVTQTGNIYALSGDDLVHVELSDKLARPRIYVTNVGSISAGDGLYFIRDNGVFKFDDEKNESYLVFRSPKLRLSAVNSLNENVFVNAYADGANGQRTHTYKLNNEVNDNPGKRLIDILPLDMKASTDISDMDLFKDKLHILIKVTVRKQAKSGGVDLAEYNAAKNRVLDLLREKSVDTDALTITFSY